MKKNGKVIDSYIIVDKLQIKQSKLLFFNNIHLMFNKGVTFLEIAEILQRMQKINNKQLKEAGFFIDSIIVNFNKKDVKYAELDSLALYFKWICSNRALDKFSEHSRNIYVADMLVIKEYLIYWTELYAEDKLLSIKNINDSVLSLKQFNDCVSRYFLKLYNSLKWIK